MSPFFRHPSGMVTTHAAPSCVSPVDVVTTTPPASPSASPSARVVMDVTATPSRTSIPSLIALVMAPYPPLTIACLPPKPPYVSSWFQCAMEIFDRGALQPYSRFAQCHPRSRRS